MVGMLPGGVDVLNDRETTAPLLMQGRMQQRRTYDIYKSLFGYTPVRAAGTCLLTCLCEPFNTDSAEKHTRTWLIGLPRKTRRIRVHETSRQNKCSTEINTTVN